MGGLFLHPSGAYLQAIGRPGAETAPAARGFQLPPHPRTAAPPAAVRGRRSPPRVPQLPAPPPRRSDPRRAAARSARARGEQWTGRGGAGWGRAGGWERSAGGPGAEAGWWHCAREATSSGTETGQLQEARAPRARERGRGRPGHEDPGAPPMRQASPTQGPSAIATLLGLGKELKSAETASSSMALGREQPELWTAHQCLPLIK